MCFWQNYLVKWRMMIYQIMKIFQQKFIFVLDKYAPMKTKSVRANNQPNVSKALQAIIRRSCLKQAANSSGNPDDLKVYKRQRNLVVNINRRDKVVPQLLDQIRF